MIYDLEYALQHAPEYTLTVDPKAQIISLIPIVESDARPQVHMHVLALLEIAGIAMQDIGEYQHGQRAEAATDASTDADEGGPQGNDQEGVREEQARRLSEEVRSTQEVRNDE